MYVVSSDSDGLPYMTLNTGYHVLTCVSYHAKIGSIYSGFGWVVPLILPKSTAMIYYYLSGTHIKHVTSPDSHGFPCMTLNIGVS